MCMFVCVCAGGRAGGWEYKTFPVVSLHLKMSRANHGRHKMMAAS